MRRRYRCRRRRRRSRSIVKRWLCVFLTLCVVGLVWFDQQLMPLIKRYAAMVAERNATLYINEAVTDLLASQTDWYGQLMTVTEDVDGNVKSMSADIAKINLLKSQITQEIVSRTASVEFQQLAIPLGTVIGGSFFTGRGPRLPIRVSTSGSVLSTLYSEFGDAGINQTNHQIYLNITVRFFVAIPSLYYSTVDVSSVFLIAESVLVGDVPDSYTSVNDDRSDLIGKIFDYADIGL